jgi:hypothetical protein
MLIPAQPGWRAIESSAFEIRGQIDTRVSIYDVIAWRDDGKRLAPVTAAGRQR